MDKQTKLAALSQLQVLEEEKDDNISNNSETKKHSSRLKVKSKVSKSKFKNSRDDSELIINTQSQSPASMIHTKESKNSDFYSEDSGDSSSPHISIKKCRREKTQESPDREPI